MPRNNPPEPHTKEWCELNPHRCKDNVPSVSIDNGYYQLGALILIATVVWKAQTKIRKQILNNGKNKSDKAE